MLSYISFQRKTNFRDMCCFAVICKSFLVLYQKFSPKFFRHGSLSATALVVYCCTLRVCALVTVRNGVFMVMLKYLNELSFYYLAAQTEELAQVTV